MGIIDLTCGEANAVITIFEQFEGSLGSTSMYSVDLGLILILGINLS